MLRNQPINYDWLYTDTYSEEYLSQSESDDTYVEVQIPHTNIELPLNNFDEKAYQFESFYKKIQYIKALEGERLYIRFEAVMSYAKIYINGTFVGEHKGGYTAFEFDITEVILEDADNTIGVYVDSNERDDIPPFGHVIDYLTYGGIYREVSLIYKSESHIDTIFVKTTDVLNKPTLEIELEMVHLLPDERNLTFEFNLLKDNEVIMNFKEGAVVVDHKKLQFIKAVEGVKLWSVDHPNLYRLIVTLMDKGTVIDTIEERIGFRSFEFRNDGFYQNGERLKIVGLNRHQSFPYVGYAMPKSAQYKDADILKNELKVNAVRLSHYPQSTHFIDRCDEIGLLVFDEIPGWQHIGNEEWKDVACANVEEMITRDRNHASIFIWGTRINESNDDHDFYTRTSTIARGLDDTRSIGGVRCIKKSELLEDVYTYNDFSHVGTNKGLENPRKVFKDQKPYLVTEYNGHMYPTKKYDDETHRINHAHRHMSVLDGIYSRDTITGGIGWCMFDYNTHKEFGSGDKVCYHGVMDIFRIPKMAAYSYASQNESEPVLHVASAMSIGEYPGGFIKEINVFTNCDYIKLFSNGIYITKFYPSNSVYKHVPHPPILINDFIGERILKEENFNDDDGNLIKKLLIRINQSGGKLGVIDRLKLGYIMKKYHLTELDAENLYTKYFGGWGSEATIYTIEGFIDDKAVKSITKGQVFSPFLECSIDHKVLVEEATYDVTRVIVRLVDEYGNDVQYANDAFKVSTSEHVEIIGPDTVSLIGGSIGFWVKTTGLYGVGFIEIDSPRYGQLKQSIEVVNHKSSFS